MKTVHFKSKKDGKEFVVKAPNQEEIENNDFIEINGKTELAEEIMATDPNYAKLSEEVRKNGELVHAEQEVYDLYYYDGEFYDFYWDTASGCIFSKLTKM